MKSIARQILLICVLLVIAIGPAAAQDTYDYELPECKDRPTIASNPVLDGNRWCSEQLALKEDGDQLLTRMAFGPDASLYAIRTYAGELVQLVDTNGDYMQDEVHVLVDDLTLPTGLVYYENSLYISGGPHIYRYDLADETLTVLVDDLPVGTGFWNGDIVVGSLDDIPETRIYVGTGGACDACESDDPERGAILSFALDGTDRQLIATGLRNPAGITIFDGSLWATDTARDGLRETIGFDEVNKIEIGGHYGWPYCVGDNHPDLESETFSCDDAISPLVRFETHSRPIALEPYIGDAFPELTDTLVVALGGSAMHEFEYRGVQVLSVIFDENQQPINLDRIIPFDTYASYPKSVLNPIPYEDYYNAYDIPTRTGYEGRNFWPNHIMDVAIHPAGWIYVSLSNGKIHVLRPHTPSED